VTDERAPHLTPHLVALVLVGGIGGTATRDLIERGVGSADGFPWATFGINVSGALLLAVLVETLARRGSDVGARRRWRLLLGTGFLGGYTTYSAFGVQTDTLVRDGRPGLALTYALATVLAGLLVSLLGISAARAERFR
jgi:CrcB protein